MVARAGALFSTTMTGTFNSSEYANAQLPPQNHQIRVHEAVFGKGSRSSDSRLLKDEADSGLYFGCLYAATARFVVQILDDHPELIQSL